MDEELYELAGRQHNRISMAQLLQLGFSRKAVRHRLAAGRLVRVADGVYACPPVTHNDPGRWMAAVLSAQDSYLNRLSAACAWGVLDRRPNFETIVRAGTKRSRDPRT